MPTKKAPKALVALSVKRLCSRCQTQVWVAPSGLAVQRKEQAALLCMPCVLTTEGLTREQIKEALTGALTYITPAQNREIRQELKRPS